MCSFKEQIFLKNIVHYIHKYSALGENSGLLFRNFVVQDYARILLRKIEQFIFIVADR